jgi:hypothetical protein
MYTMLPFYVQGIATAHVSVCATVNIPGTVSGVSVCGGRFSKAGSTIKFI